MRLLKLHNNIKKEGKRVYKLKIKRTNQECITTKYFSTTQEVASYLSNVLNINNIDDMLRSQKEFNFRFYLSHKAK